MPGHRRKLKGRGFMDFVKKANNRLRKTKVVSKLGGLYGKYGGMAGLPGASIVGKVASGAQTLGYGRRRSRVRRVGTGLRLAGGMRRRVMHF